MRPKQKSTSGGGEHEASRAKKSDGKLSLAAAILQANNLTSKTKPLEVEAMYKSLEEGLGQCFPYGQDPLPCKIPAKKIHLAPDFFKYHVFVEKQKELVLLVLLALCRIFGTCLLMSLGLFHLGALYVLFHRCYVVVCEEF